VGDDNRVAYAFLGTTVEGNYTGQFARLLRAETGYKPDHFYGRYDGEPFASRDIADKIREVVA